MLTSSQSKCLQIPDTKDIHAVVIGVKTAHNSAVYLHRLQPRGVNRSGDMSPLYYRLRAIPIIAPNEVCDN